MVVLGLDPWIDPTIHVLFCGLGENVDDRVEPDHDGERWRIKCTVTVISTHHLVATIKKHGVIPALSRDRLRFVHVLPETDELRAIIPDQVRDDEDLCCIRADAGSAIFYASDIMSP